ncbi:protein of unknown function [Streptomyces murinus]
MRLKSSPRHRGGAPLCFTHFVYCLHGIFISEGAALYAPSRLAAFRGPRSAGQAACLMAGLTH